VVATPIAVNSRGLEGSARPAGRRGFKRAVGLAVGMVSLAALALLFVGRFEDRPLTSVSGPSARAQLPADLFAPPPAPKPRIVVRYMAPRNMPAAPAAPAAAPAAPAASAAAPAATPTPRPSHRPSPSPSPTPRGDD
jgi:hypothetical protein